MTNADFISLIIPLHPKLVHFPIALFFTALLLQILSQVFKKNLLSECSFIIYLTASILTPLVVLSGICEADRLHLNHPLLNSHKLYAFLVMGFSLAWVPFYWYFYDRFPKAFKHLYLVVLLAICVLIILCAHYGGKMVYEYAVGVSQ